MHEQGQAFGVCLANEVSKPACAKTTFLMCSFIYAALQSHFLQMAYPLNPL